MLIIHFADQQPAHSSVLRIKLQKQILDPYYPVVFAQKRLGKLRK